MEFDRWVPRYRAIQAEFGFDLGLERGSADRLRELLPPGALVDPVPRLARRLAGRECVVVGRGPDAGPPPLWRRPAAPRRPALIAADGATASCLAAGLVPDVIATDLDGPVASEVAANARGALVVLHAHGDNRPSVERWAPEFTGELIGSWAGAPYDGLVNLGGFTDGDRAAFLAEHVGAARILLWGFDFARVDATDPSVRDRKLAKLRWARRLLGELAVEGRTPIEEWRPDGAVRPFHAPTGPAIQ